VPAVLVTTTILPYGASFGAALGYEPRGVVFLHRGGRVLMVVVSTLFCVLQRGRKGAGNFTFNAKKAGIAFVSKTLSRSFGPVEVMLGGPSRPVEEVHTSRLHVISVFSLV